jgi:hypothetical protein
MNVSDGRRRPYWMDELPTSTRRRFAVPMTVTCCCRFRAEAHLPAVRARKVSERSTGYSHPRPSG